MRICNTDFIDNAADEKGGAVYNRAGSTTTMVNCILAGNVADDLGGATCNADGGDIPDGALTELNMHNCLIAGNEAAATGADGGGHLNRDGGVSTLINCTVVKNVAFAGSGGIENANGGDTLTVQNCIVWGNDDDVGNGGLDNQLHFGGAAPQGVEVDQNVIEDCNDSCFPGTNNSNKGQGVGEDPDAVNVIANPTWIDCIFDPDTGITTFDMTVQVSALDNESLFQPDSASPLQLLIQSVDEGADTISCYGNWGDLHIDNPKTGTIFDYHIANGSSAIDFGDFAYIDSVANGGIGDVCDLDGNGNKTEALPLDLDGADRREQGSNPDSGAYEIE